MRCLLIFIAIYYLFFVHWMYWLRFMPLVSLITTCYVRCLVHAEISIEKKKRTHLIADLKWSLGDFVYAFLWSIKNKAHFFWRANIFFFSFASNSKTSFHSTWCMSGAANKKGHTNKSKTNNVMHANIVLLRNKKKCV